MDRRLRILLTTTVLGTVALAAPVAHASPPPAALMEKLAAYATSFERERTQASYDVAGKLEVIDGDNEVSSRKEVVAHVEGNGGDAKVTVVRYVEDGKDKTAEGVKEAEENAARRKKRRASGKEVKLPVRSDQQARYVFDETERSADGTRVLLHFAPKNPEDDTVEGSAWVDDASGTVVSASFQPSKTSIFISYLHFSVEFGAQTAVGPAVSKVVVEGEGGIWFFRKHFRATATLSHYAFE